MKRKKQASTILFILALICLLAIGTILASGIIKNRSKNQNQAKKPIDSNVLGEIIEQQISSAPSKINNFFGQPIEETKEVVSQKLTEVEKQVVTNIQKEISSLTASQIDALKLQICRDLGVVVP